MNVKTAIDQICKDHNFNDNERIILVYLANDLNSFLIPKVFEVRELLHVARSNKAILEVIVAGLQIILLAYTQSETFKKIMEKKESIIKSDLEK